MNSKDIDSVFKTALYDFSYEKQKNLNSMLSASNTVELVKLSLNFESMKELSHHHHRKKIPFVSFAAENFSNSSPDDTRQIFDEFIFKRHLKPEETINFTEFSQI